MGCTPVVKGRGEEKGFMLCFVIICILNLCDNYNLKFLLGVVRIYVLIF